MEHEHAISLTGRAMKKSLPDRAIVTKDARKTINSATSVFTLYIASIAHEISVANKRSTITLHDVLQALCDADFEHFIEPIEACVQEAKVVATRKKYQKDVDDKREETEVTSEVTEQFEEVAIDTNEEDADGDKDEDMMSADESLDANGKDRNANVNAEVQDSVDVSMQDEVRAEPCNHSAQKGKIEHDDLVDAME
ncbi:unnamed protein product [Peronospora belbahrii]|uniref:Transcription factor CBF/NF-Y/archaeal histone domain-containing protein n=1 Tax=Peronospora belbahrii TaxID=622444 RepID=A0AAU9L439_9STRA|nr:unnamed protein product [Peronospora belbahrii]CAH0516426.1 unnamed protein product [Peronospora belbahrii]